MCFGFCSRCCYFCCCHYRLVVVDLVSVAAFVTVADAISVAVSVAVDVVIVGVVFAVAAVAVMTKVWDSLSQMLLQEVFYFFFTIAA